MGRAAAPGWPRRLHHLAPGCTISEAKLFPAHLNLKGIGLPVESQSIYAASNGSRLAAILAAAGGELLQCLSGASPLCRFNESSQASLWGRVRQVGAHRAIRNACFGRFAPRIRSLTFGFPCLLEATRGSPQEKERRQRASVFPWEIAYGAGFSTACKDHVGHASGHGDSHRQPGRPGYRR